MEDCLKTKICEVCGKGFLGKYKAKYCSDTCRKIGFNNNVKHYGKKCIICGTNFTSRSEKSRFCCERCKGKYRRSEMKVKICNWCGKDFIGNMNKKYCCKKCAHQGRLKKSKETFKKTQGVEWCTKNKNVQLKREQTCLKVFGTKNAMQNSKVKEKKEQTCLKIFGEKNVMKNNNVMLKRKNTFKQNHNGLEYMLQDKDILDKAKKTNMERYRVPYYCMTKECGGKTQKDSKVNQEFRNFLKEKGFIIGDEDKDYPLGDKQYDIKIGNTLLEINPRPHHNLTIEPLNPEVAQNCKRLFELQKLKREGIKLEGKTLDEWENLSIWRKEKEYKHFTKTKIARDNGYKCIQIFDWDDREKVIHLIEDNKKTIYARKCEVKQISHEEAHNLFEAYHLQGDTQKNKNNIYIGLIYEGQLVMAISYGKPRYNKEYQWEILRLCSHKDYKIVGGAGKIYKFFLELTNAESVISYCDMSKFDGNVYEQLGFKLLKWNAPSRHWWFTGITYPKKEELQKELGYEIKLPPENKIHFTDNQINLARGFDQLLGDCFGRFGKGTRNDELLRKFGYVEIYDCGQATYIRKKEEK